MLQPNDSPFVSYDDEFAQVLGDAPRLVKVVDADAHEGPVYVPDEDALYFTALPKPTDVPLPGSRNVAITRLALNGDRFPVSPENLSTVREPANMANGMTLDRGGRLVICEQGTRSDHGRISRLDPETGEIETVVDHWAGLRLNSPNDVVVKGDGTVWFTDPSYGFLQGFKPAPMVGDYVYRYDPRTDRLSVVADSFDKPNGLAFSPDESVLYIADSGAIHGPGDYSIIRPHHVVAFDVIGGRHLADGRLFAVTTPGFPDGLKVDAAGHVYVSAFSGVLVFNPCGDLIGEIRLPGAVNFAFGGSDGNVLFITADNAIWAATLRATGVPSRAAVDPTPAAARSVPRASARGPALGVLMAE
jgi:gluconolactonase